MLDDTIDTSRSRLVSFVLEVAYAIIAFAMGGIAASIRMVMFCFLPMFCIWFPDAMGDTVSGNITRSSPPMFVFVFGWIVLLMPIWSFLLAWLLISR